MHNYSRPQTPTDDPRSLPSYFCEADNPGAMDLVCSVCSVCFHISNMHVLAQWRRRTGRSQPTAKQNLIRQQKGRFFHAAYKGGSHCGPLVLGLIDGILSKSMLHAIQDAQVLNKAGNRRTEWHYHQTILELGRQSVWLNFVLKLTSTMRKKIELLAS